MHVYEFEIVKFKNVLVGYPKLKKFKKNNSLNSALKLCKKISFFTAFFEFLEIEQKEMYFLIL